MFKVFFTIALCVVGLVFVSKMILAAETPFKQIQQVIYNSTLDNRGLHE